MNIPTLIVLGLLVIAVSLALKSVFIDIKKGNFCGGCGGSCNGSCRHCDRLLTEEKDIIKK